MTREPHPESPVQGGEGGDSSASYLREAGVVALVLVLIVVVMAGGWRLAGPARAKKNIVTETGAQRPMGPFALTERSGRTISQSDVAGRFVVVNFVFTSCSLSCLQVNQHMAEIQKRVANQPDVQLLSITLDPRTDTPATLTKFADRFGAEAGRWWFLTGEKSAVYELIETSFLARNTEDPANLTPGGFIGMERIYVVDPQGQPLAYFNGLQSNTPEDVVDFIARQRRGKMER